MAIAHVGDGGYNSAAQSGGTATVTFAFPAGIATGNLVIACVTIDYLTSGATIATPTGWTQIGLTGEIQMAGAGSDFTKLYLFGAIYSGGLTGTFVGSGLGANFGIDGEIKGFSGTGSTIATALGNFTAYTPGSNATTTVIPGPSGFTSGQWNYWTAIDNINPVAPSTSPTLNNVYYNAGVYNAHVVGTTTPGSAPGSETITWTTSGMWGGAGVTILPLAPITFAQGPWFATEQRRPRLPVDKPQVWDNQQPLRSFGTIVPKIIPPEPFWDNRQKWALWNRPVFDQPEFWRNRGILVPTQMPPEPFWDPVKPYETAKQHLSRLGFDPPNLQLFSVPAAVLPTAWFDPPIRWKAPPGFEIPPPKPFGITVPTQLPPESFWEPVKDRRGNRQTLWNTDVLQPIVVVQPSFVSTDFWWTASRAPYRIQVWDGNQTPQFFGVPVPTAKPSESWFDPPKRWKAPPGFEEPPWRNLGIPVPTAKPSEPWFDPPQRWAPKQWFEVTWFQNYGIQVPTTKPSEPWFDPPIRWKAGPGFEPQPLRSIISFTATPSSALPIPWFDPPKRWLAPPGFEPTWTRPFGTQVPTSVLPPEWWTAIRAKPPVSIWSLDVPGPFPAVQVTVNFVGAEFWTQARRQAAALSWDGISPLSPLASPPFIGGDWWVGSKRAPAIASWDGSVPSSVLRPILIGSEWWTGTNVRRRAEWWDFLPPGSRLAPYMDQAWWGLAGRGVAASFVDRAGDWRLYSPIAPSVGVSTGWQGAFFDPRGPTRRATADWSLGPFFAFVGTPTFVAPLQIVNAPTQTFVVEGGPVSDVVYAIDIRNFK